MIWLRDNAEELGVAPDQLVVGGESAGGGLTAALTLLARDRGELAVAFQVPLYPMLYDRTTASSRDNAMPLWNTVSNDTAWDRYRGALRGGDVPADAAPARATDLAGLAPTLTFVGSIEPFHDEVVDWCECFRGAGVPVRFEVFAGAFHGFDLVAPGAPVSSRARASFIDGFATSSAATVRRNRGLDSPAGGEPVRQADSPRTLDDYRHCRSLQLIDIELGGATVAAAACNRTASPDERGSHHAVPNTGAARGHC